MPTGAPDVTSAMSGGPAPRGRAVLFRVVLIGGALALCWHLTADRLSEFDAQAFWFHLGSLSPLAILLAIGATAVSFAAVACYDLIAFRTPSARRSTPGGQAVVIPRAPIPQAPIPQAPIPQARLLRVGASATALGQLLGFGLIVGAFVRWRLLHRHGVTRGQAMGASLVVMSGFLFGLLVMSGLAAVGAPIAVSTMTGLPPSIVTWFGALTVAGTAVALWLGHRRAGAMILGRRVTLPPPRVAVAQISLAGVDILFAGFALWLLTPEPAGVPVGQMLLAYLGALSLCLIANAPGGFGPFEAALLIALPHVPPEPLLAGVAAFRGIFYVLPGLAGLAVLAHAETNGHIRQNRQSPGTSQRAVARPPDKWFDPAPATDRDLETVREILSRSHRADDALALLGDKSFLFAPGLDAFLMFRVHGRAIVALGDPAGSPAEAPRLCERFLTVAAARGLTPVFYKTGPRVGDHLREQGLAVDRLGTEAVVDLRTFTIAGRERREIRRKIRQAGKAGVEIRFHEPGAAPLHELRPIADHWLAARGGREAAFSMGRFEPEYLRHFPVYEARVGGTSVAFLSLWRSGDGREWSLDLMRYGAGAPPGVMQALIVAACDGARAAGAEAFNLCLAPLSGLNAPNSLAERAGHLAYQRLDHIHGLQGLFRFKAAFRPDWQPRYIGRPPGLSGLYGMWAVRRLIMPGLARPAGRAGGEGASHPDAPAPSITPVVPAAPDVPVEGTILPADAGHIGASSPPHGPAHQVAGEPPARRQGGGFA